MPSENLYLYDKKGQDWFLVATESDIADSKDYVDTNFLKTIDVDNSRVVVFIVTDEIKQGLQKAHVPIPFDCTLENIDVSVMTSGTSDLEIQIQKSTNLTSWTDVLDSPIVVPSGSNQELINTFTNPAMLNKGDRITLNVLTDSKCENLAMNIEITKQ